MNKFETTKGERALRPIRVTIQNALSKNLTMLLSLVEEPTGFPRCSARNQRRGGEQVDTLIECESVASPCRIRCVGRPTLSCEMAWRASRCRCSDPMHGHRYLECRRVPSARGGAAQERDASSYHRERPADCCHGRVAEQCPPWRPLCRRAVVGGGKPAEALRSDSLDQGLSNRRSGEPGD